MNARTIRLFPVAILISIVLSCSSEKVEEQATSPIERISIFEIYLKESHQLDELSLLLRDTFELPVEWKPFDFFGDGAVYDAAFYLGNTTLELLALYGGDSTLTQEARYNRILFESENINTTSSYLAEVSLAHAPAFDFNIVSNNSPLTIGKQINLDSLSSISNVNIAFWEYLPSAFNFAERGIRAESLPQLESELESAFNSNPMGIVGLKEVHLSLSEEGIKQWNRLLGQSEKNVWELADGLTISAKLSSEEKGVEWIKIRVKNLSEAREFLSKKNLSYTENNQLLIDRTKLYGLKIILEE